MTIHKQLASSCFNKVWDLLSKEERTERESEEMVHLCHGSFWHWTQVEDHTPTNLSVGYWQLARVYAVIGQGSQALDYAIKCMKISADAKLDAFYIAYAYEAAARAYSVIGESAQKDEALARAADYAERIADAESRGWVTADLATIS
ncbi:hypothetical protein I8J30_11105 [Paenibacillus sp. DLE-14]|uniref:Uncharacterized protein n=2 Tax=Paenibacillus lignilyticus TaxID=1172615 RepID=A0ABS5CBB3_9BACL|nr:hypothetical protein [Paenibacillus lignilyticus]